MLAFRYLIVVDETFTVEDNRGARQFLSEVLTGFPAVDVGYLVRYSRFLPLINAPLTGDFVSPPSVGPAMVTTYRHFFSEKPWLAALRQPKRVDGVQEGDAESFQTIGEVWSALSRVVSQTSPPRMSGDTMMSRAELFEVSRRYEMVICLPSVEEDDDPTRPPKTASLAEALVDVMPHPLWCCPRWYQGTRRVVFAATQNGWHPALWRMAHDIARALNVSLVTLGADDRQDHPGREDQQVPSDRLWNEERDSSPWMLRQWRDIPGRLSPDDLVVMGVGRRSWFTRLFGDHSRRTLAANVPGATLFVPPTGVWRTRLTDDQGRLESYTETKRPPS